MKNANSQKTGKPSKGKRLGWSPLKKEMSMNTSMDGVRGRLLSDDEIRSRRQQAGEKSTPLVP